MDIQQLKYYRELCRVKNFTEAGFVCSLSQSALSKQIRRLEKELNVTLIRRNTRKFELTEEGEIFLEYAGQALERYEKMLEDIHSKKEIHIGSMTVLSPYHFAKVLAAFHEQHPDIDLVLDEHTADQIVAHMDEYDFAILRTLLITDTERYCMLPLYDDYLCAVVYSSHPLAGKSTVSLVDTADYPFLQYSEGAALLDSEGDLEPGCPLCPPEGDAETGMMATNSVASRTGNVSAGTSVFAMVVLEKPLSKAYSSLDIVTTPDGRLVAMSHSNNCTGGYDAWFSLFGEVVKALGFDVKKPVLYDTLLAKALEGDPDCGGLLSYGYISGEHITGFSEGRPLSVRHPDAHFTLANFVRAELFTSLCAMRTGLDILFENEGASLDMLSGHGGFFKTAAVGQRIMAAAAKTPCRVLKTAGEGGAWGIALLADYLSHKDMDLSAYLDSCVFASAESSVVSPDPEDMKGFDEFLRRYHEGLAIERAAVEHLGKE